MYQFFVEPEQIHISDKTVIISGPDLNHMKNVLRMKPGEEFNVSNGIDDKEYRCAVRTYESDYALCELRFIKEDNVELGAEIYLFQGLPKADKMELIIQKAVELGAYSIIPVETKRCVVKLDPKKVEAKTKRWQEIAKAAAKQSKRGIIPKVEQPISFAKALEMASQMEVKCIPYEMAEGMDKTRQMVESVKPGQRVAVFIGPEGGFEETEIEKAMEAGVEPVTLGRRILRTETAGLTILSWLMYQLEKDPNHEYQG